MKTERDEDYLVCGEYQEQIHKKSSEYPGFITFQHDNGNFYFAWVDGDKIILRSEAYPDADKMERGIKAVIKNRDLAERYSVDENHGAHFLVLWGGGDHQVHTGHMGSHNEVGRSCPQKSRRDTHDLLLSKGLAFADKVVPLSDADKAIAHTVIEKIAPAATAITTAASLASNESKSEKPKAAAVSTHTPKAAPIVTNTGSVSKSGGFNWLWLLPLLLIPLFFLWKSCNKKSVDAEVTTPATTTTTTSAAAPVTADTLKPAQIASTPPPAAPSCDLHWILYDFNQAVIRSDAKKELETMAKILKDNAEYVGEIKAHTDGKGTDEYNQKLSQNRAANAKAILTQLGIAASRITISASSESDPIATNTDDDTGRQYNRRSELYVKDKSGKEVCKSIAPEVPGTLKVK